jgi:O-antigen/teichoic acid export membrane protein
VPVTRGVFRANSQDHDATRARVEAILVSLALAGNNGASYLVTVVAARTLAPAVFGEFSSLLAVLVVGVVPAMGVQTVVALRIARARDGAPMETGSLFSLAATTSFVVTLVSLAMVPVLLAVLHLESPFSALWLAASLAPLTLLGLFHGILQGTRRFAVLAVLIVLEGIGKIGGTLIGLLVARTSEAALAGTAIGSVIVVVIGWLICGRPLPVSGGVQHLGQVLHAAQAMFALVLLVNVDLVLARHHLPPADAGQYAIGAVVTKIAYWLPQAVGVVVLPRLANAEGRRRTVPIALVVCAALDAVVLAVALLFGSTVVGLIGGARYTSSTLAVWPFAVVGSLLALVQILLFSRIASADRKSTALVWAAVGTEIVLVSAWLHDSAGEVITAAVIATLALAAFGGVIEYVTARGQQRSPVD